MRAFKVGDVRVRIGSRADLMAEAHRAVELLQSGERVDDDVRGPVRAHLAALDRLNAHAPHAAADDTLYILDEDEAGTATPDGVGPHRCYAHELPVGVYILNDGLLCAVTTSPTTREGKTRFVVDAGGRTEHVEYLAARLVDYWRPVRSEGRGGAGA